MKEANVFGPLLCNNRVFPYANLTMENPSSVTVGTDNLSSEITHSDKSMPRLARWELHTMNRMETPWHCHAQKFLDQKRVMNPEVFTVIIGDIAVIVAKLVKTLEWRAVNTKVDTIARDGPNEFARVSLIDRITVTDDLFDSFNIF
jgi:hypothetical protein